MIEVKGIAQYHIALELCAESECQNMMLYSHGTTKFGCSYTTFEVRKNWWAITLCWDGGSLAADAQTQLDVLHEILGTFCDSSENKDEIITSTFINIKNLRSDCCAVQKQCNDVFIEFWKNISTTTTKNFGLYSLEQQEKMTKVNQFFYSLHCLVHFV